MNTQIKIHVELSVSPDDDELSREASLEWLRAMIEKEKEIERLNRLKLVVQNEGQMLPRYDWFLFP